MSQSHQEILAALQQRAEREVRLLLTLATVIGEANDFDAALQAALDLICEETAWILGEIWLPTADGSRLCASEIYFCRDAAAVNLQRFCTISKTLTFPPHTGLPGRVWVSGQPEWARDLARLAGPEFPRLKQAQAAGLKTALGVPVGTNGEVLAVLVMYRDTAHPEEERMVELISAVAVQLGEILQRKRMEVALRENEQFLRSIYTGAEVGIAVIDVTETGELLITAINPALEQMSGWTDASIRGKWLSEVEPRLAPETLTAVEAQARRCIELNELVEFEMAVNRPSGTNWWLVRLQPLQDKQERVYRLIGTVLSITARKLADIEKNQLMEGLDRQQEELGALAIRLANLHEAERQQLARELHDRLGQNLTAAVFHLNFIQTQLADIAAPQVAEIQARLNDTLTLIEQTTDRIRTVITELRPPMLDEYGLVEALDWYADQFTVRTGIEVDLRSAGFPPRLAGSLENVLFRITQEALNNVAEHAQASRATISVMADEERVQLTVADDGIGFDPETAHAIQNGSHLGLVNITERAEGLGGHCRIESQPGQGAQVVVEVPR